MITQDQLLDSLKSELRKWRDSGLKPLDDKHIPAKTCNTRYQGNPDEKVLPGDFDAVALAWTKLGELGSEDAKAKIDGKVDCRLMCFNSFANRKEPGKSPWYFGCASSGGERYFQYHIKVYG